MAQQNFSADVGKWARKTEERLIAVFRFAAQFAYEGIARRTPVDLGYARKSLTMTIAAPLPMTGKRGDGYEAPDYNLTLAGSKLGDVIYISYVANYAGFLEYGARGRTGVGMVRLTAQNWPQIVQRAVAQVRK